ncbi:MAG: protein-disulfide reductase DsbD family protein [Flavobacteriaceae bacterium]|tara:strand:+ start:1395 stop:3374 length:1980 start_codon:yes stop_codon:yes gene_type:complete
MRLFILTFFVVFNSFSQIEEPVTWNSNIDKISDQNYLITIDAYIQNNWRLYSQNLPKGGPEPTEFIFKEKQGYESLRSFEESKSIKKYDKLFELDLNYFEKGASFSQEIKLIDKNLEKIDVEINYQACDDRLCIFRSELITIPLSENFTSIEKKLDKKSILKSKELLLNIKNKDFYTSKVSDDSKNNSYLKVFMLGIIGGILALLTPCVLPMMPLTVSYFLKKSNNKQSGIFNSSLYGFFIILVYFLLSLPFHFLDFLDPGILNTISTSVITNFVFFVVFVFFAFSFFGYYDISLPSSWANKSESSSNLRNVGGIFFMALTLSIVSFSCTGPILGSLLAGSINSNGPIELTLGMLGFGFALGVPFSILAFFPKLIKNIPKSGGWMNTLKVTLGFLELALALKFLSNADLIGGWNFLKREIFIILWALISLSLGIYLIGGLNFIKNYNTNLKLKLYSSIPFVFSFYLIYSLFSDKNELKFLSGFPPPEFYTIQKTDNDCPLNLNCFKDYNKGYDYAKINNKPILIDFTGWACVNCRRMEENVWSDPEIFSLLNNEFVLISLYVDDRKKLDIKDQFNFKFLNGRIKKIESLGQKWATFQAINFNSASQPYYAQINTDLELLNSPIQYSGKKEFKNWLKKGLERSGQLLDKKNKNIYNYNLW